MLIVVCASSLEVIRPVALGRFAFALSHCDMEWFSRIHETNMCLPASSQDHDSNSNPIVCFDVYVHVSKGCF